MNDAYRPAGKDYLHVNDDIKLKLDWDYIERLKSTATGDQEHKCMMCLHNDIRSHVHEIINVYPEGAYVRPHYHPFKTETKIMIEGKMQVVVFDQMGEIIDEFVMNKDGIFIFRLDRGIIHTNIPLTDVVFYEVIEGPYKGKDDSIFPDWAPDPTDNENVRIIMEKIKNISRQD